MYPLSTRTLSPRRRVDAPLGISEGQPQDFAVVLPETVDTIVGVEGGDSGDDHANWNSR